MSPALRRLIGPVSAAAAAGLLALSWCFGLHLVLGGLVLPFWALAGVLALVGLFVTDRVSVRGSLPVVSLVVQAVVGFLALGSLGLMLLLDHTYSISGDTVIRTGTTILNDLEAGESGGDPDGSLRDGRSGASRRKMSR